MNGYLGVACATCGNSEDPLGVMFDGSGALVCFWCNGVAAVRAERES